MLLQNVTAILLQNAAEVYYKMRQVFLLQNATFITNCDSTFSLSIHIKISKFQANVSDL